MTNNNNNNNSSTPFFISGLTSLVARHVTSGTNNSSRSLVEDGVITTWNRSQFPEIDPARSVAIAFPLILIVLCTVCGNLLVLLAVITTRKLRTATNYFIVNLAIADMMLGVTVLPFSTTIEILDEFWIFGQTLCDMWVTVDVLCCTASIYGLCVISVDRYIGVSKPLVHHQIVNKHRAILINLGVWLLAAAICVVPFFGWRKSLSVEVSGRCEVNEDRAYVIFSATCSFFLPCTIVIIVYWRIYLKAVQQTRFMKLGYKEAKMTSKGENGVVLRIHTGTALTTSSNNLAPPAAPLQLRQSMSKRDSAVAAVSDLAQQLDTNLRQRKIDWTKFKRERRAARTLGIVVGVFIACWVPFFVILPTNAFCECLPPQLFKVVFWLGYCNSLMNPFIYGADSREFQMAFKRLLCGKKSGYSTPGTPRCASSFLTKTRRQMLVKSHSGGSAGGGGGVLNTPGSPSLHNGTASSHLRPSMLPTPQEEENESSASADGMSTTVVKPAKSNTSLNRIMLNISSNGLLAPPAAGSNSNNNNNNNGGVTQPLLSDYNEQNNPISVETALIEGGGGTTVVVSRPSANSEHGSLEVQSPTRSILVATKVVSTSTSSLKLVAACNKSHSPSPAPIADFDSEQEPPTTAAATTSHNSIKSKKNTNNKQQQQLQDITAERLVPTSSMTSQPSQQERPPGGMPQRDRITSISSLSTLSSPSDSDDEELKRRKRASREHRPKKHFIQRSKNTNSKNFYAKRMSVRAPLRRLSALLLGGVGGNRSTGRANSTTLTTITSSASIQQQQEMTLQDVNNNNPVQKNDAHINPTNDPAAPLTPTSLVDDLASLAFRRLLMVRFARRVRAKSKAALGGDQGDEATVGSPDTTTPGISSAAGEGTTKPIQTLAPQSRWRIALSKITSPPSSIATVGNNNNNNAVIKKPPPTPAVTTTNLTPAPSDVGDKSGKLSHSNSSIAGNKTAATALTTTAAMFAAVAVRRSSTNLVNNVDRSPSPSLSIKQQQQQQKGMTASINNLNNNSYNNNNNKSILPNNVVMMIKSDEAANDTLLRQSNVSLDANSSNSVFTTTNNTNSQISLSASQSALNNDNNNNNNNDDDDVDADNFEVEDTITYDRCILELEGDSVEL